MKRCLLLVVLLVVALGSMAFATTAELQMISGLSTATVTGTGSADYINPNFNGWDINIELGNSNSPIYVPYGIDLVSLSATCNVGEQCSSSPLDVYFSDTGFNGALGYTATYSATDEAGGTTTWTAWVNPSNALLGTTGCDIGTVALSGSTFGGSVSGCGPYSGPVSITGEATFSLSEGSSSASFSTDANVTAVPEPASIALFGSGLLGLAGFARRRFLK